LLTPSEWRVADAVRHGLSNPDIARRLGVSVDAIKYHVANSLQKLGLASRAELRQWTGIPRNSVLMQSETHMQEPTVWGALGQISRQVKDIEAARQWYADVLGLRHLYSFGNLAFFDCQGVRLFLSESDGPDGSSILYFRVADIHAAHAQMQARGIEFTHAPHLIHRHPNGTEEWMAFFKDNEGRPLAILAQPKPAA
jgi:DNA-binding CsgD family transcriptional regulator/catechol 2,3-dioxygenase-like lactoylglutathione lyase family enzyme